MTSDQTSQIPSKTIAGRWIKLVGGPADGAQLNVPAEGYGKVIVHTEPSNHWGAWLGEPAHYQRNKGEDYATYVENNNPSDESQDWDLPMRSPYLEGESQDGLA